MILSRIWQHDLAWSFRRSPVTIVAAVLTVVCVGAALLARVQVAEGQRAARAADEGLGVLPRDIEGAAPAS